MTIARFGPGVRPRGGRLVHYVDPAAPPLPGIARPPALTVCELPVGLDWHTAWATVMSECATCGARVQARLTARGGTARL